MAWKLGTTKPVSLTYDRKKNTAIVGSFSGELFLLSQDEGAIALESKINASDWPIINALDISPNGKLIAVGSIVGPNLVVISRKTTVNFQINR